MPDGTRNDPYGQFNFTVEIEGMTVGGFSEVSGLTQETTIIEYRNGDEKYGTVRKIPGHMKYNNIVLKRGWTKDKSLWDWRKQVIGKGRRLTAKPARWPSRLSRSRTKGWRWRD
jgi:phage tail-like protein